MSHNRYFVKLSEDRTRLVPGYLVASTRYPNWGKGLFLEVYDIDKTFPVRYFYKIDRWGRPVPGSLLQADHKPIGRWEEIGPGDRDTISPGTPAAALSGGNVEPEPKPHVYDPVNDLLVKNDSLNHLRILADNKVPFPDAESYLAPGDEVPIKYEGIVVIMTKPDDTNPRSYTIHGYRKDGQDIYSNEGMTDGDQLWQNTDLTVRLRITQTP